MNASPHAHTYDSNKKETKRAHIYKYKCMIMKQMVIYPQKKKELEPNKCKRPHYRQLNNISPLFKER